MIYNLSENIRRDLLHWPETGMGYQIAEVNLPNYKREKLLILNATVGLPLHDDFTMKKEYRQLNYRMALNDSVPQTMTLVRALSRKEWHTIAREPVSGNKKPAKENPKEKADGKEKFVRLSAYANDMRVDTIRRRFLPGTYATTDDDYHECVRINDDPVERYALPNDEEIKYAYYVRPTKDDSLQRGIVEPAFGKRGGGVEVYFEDGTSNGTYLGRVDYGNFM